MEIIGQVNKLICHIISNYLLEVAISRQQHDKSHSFEQLSTCAHTTHINEQIVQSAQSLEPILFPKLRIDFADFPYSHYSRARGYSPWRPDADLGTARYDNQSRPRIFMDHSQCSGRHQNVTLLPIHNPISE